VKNKILGAVSGGMGDDDIEIDISLKT